MDKLISIADDLEKKLDPYFRKQAPKMPEGLRNFFADFAYIFLLIYAGLLVMGVLALVSFITGMRVVFGFLGPLADLPTIFLWISLFFAVVNLYLIYKGFSAVKDKKAKGWKYLFYIALVDLLQDLVFFNVVGFVLAAIINFYILFQIKEKFR